MTRRSGFTLIELLLSIAIIGLIAGISLPISASMQRRNDLDESTAIILAAGRRAVLLSQAVNADAGWSIHLGSGTVTLYQGASYILRNQSFDEIDSLPVGVNTAGLADINFDKLTGWTATAGQITISNNSGSRNINVNAKGIFGY